MKISRLNLRRRKRRRKIRRGRRKNLKWKLRLRKRRERRKRKRRKSLKPKMMNKFDVLELKNFLEEIMVEFYSLWIFNYFVTVPLLLSKDNVMNKVFFFLFWFYSLLWRSLFISPRLKIVQELFLIQFFYFGLIKDFKEIWK